MHNFERTRVLPLLDENCGMRLARLTREYVARKWIPSVGDGDGEHFREPPPGTRHAICKPGSRYCRVHEDQYNPHAGPLDAVAHVLFEWKGAPIVVGGIVLSALLLASSRNSNQVHYRCPTCGADTAFSPYRGFSYQCQNCKYWFYVP